PYSQAGLLEIDPIQFPAEFDQGAIAAGGDVRDDRAHDRIDLGRCLALGGEKGTEALGESRRAAVETDRHGPVLPGHSGRSALNGVAGTARQPRASVVSSTWIGRTPAGQDGPRSASSASRHSTSSRNVPPPEKMRFTTPAGGSVSENSTASRLSTASLPAGVAFRHLPHLSRPKRRTPRHRLSSGFVPSAESQSKRLSAITRRFSCGRHMTSATLTSASWRWVDTTSRSSRSRATNFTGSMTRAPCRFRRY